jgi:hypothetical protein
VDRVGRSWVPKKSGGWSSYTTVVWNLDQRTNRTPELQDKATTAPKEHMMRSYIGTTILNLLGIALSCLGITKHLLPLLIVAALALLGAVLSYPVRKPGRTAFGIGDFSGSTFGNVYTDADDFIQGNAREALFINIIHKSHKQRD